MYEWLFIGPSPVPTDGRIFARKVFLALAVYLNTTATRICSSGSKLKQIKEAQTAKLQVATLLTMK